MMDLHMLQGYIQTYIYTKYSYTTTLVYIVGINSWLIFLVKKKIGTYRDDKLAFTTGRCECSWQHVAVYVCGKQTRSLLLAQHTSAYVSIRQHTSQVLGEVLKGPACTAYVSIREHMLAYVSVCKHTSAYVSLSEVLKGPVVKAPLIEP
jgi:hypothetical protein